jgi:ABC-type lipoprotein export system ATPase subunit
MTFIESKGIIVRRPGSQALLIVTHDTRIINRFENVLHLNSQMKEVA